MRKVILWLCLLISGVCSGVWAQGEPQGGPGVGDQEGKEYQDLLIEEQINRTLKIRDRMLLAHEILGWSTVGLLAVNTFITTPGPYDQDVHTVMGITAGSLYFSTAMLSFFTPKLHEDTFVFGGDKESPTKFIHKILAFIHFPAMLATIALGFIAHGADEGEIDISTQSRIAIKKAHTATSLITLMSLTMSLVVVYID